MEERREKVGRKEGRRTGRTLSIRKIIPFKFVALWDSIAITVAQYTTCHAGCRRYLGVAFWTHRRS